MRLILFDKFEWHKLVERLISSTHPGVAVQGAIFVDEILYKKVHGGLVAEEKVSRCQQIK